MHTMVKAPLGKNIDKKNLMKNTCVLYCVNISSTINNDQLITLYGFIPRVATVLGYPKSP